MKHLLVFVTVVGGFLAATEWSDPFAVGLALTIGAFATFCFEMSGMFADQNKRIREQRIRIGKK